jgi:CO/xanthine dehydrogenase FAD-binding subunit
MPIDEVFIGPTITSIASDAVVREIRFPVRTGAATGTGFFEVSPRKGDFALAAAAAEVVLDADGKCTGLNVGVGGVGDTPVRLDAVSGALAGTPLEAADIAGSIAEAMREVEADDDLHASAGYRRRVAGVLAARAVAAARDDALTRIRNAPDASH